MTDSAISANEVWKYFRLYREKNQYLKTALLRGRRASFDEFWALSGVSLEIAHGETLGIIGSNGSGKSTFLKCLAGILNPDKGSIRINGRVAALLELGAGFHPDLTGRENVFLNGAILGMSRHEIETKFDEIVAFSGIERFIDVPVKNYSSGMVVRLGFSIAINVDPEILLIDEVLAVGDASFQQLCYQRIEDFRRQGRTIVFVSHGLSQVVQLCSRAAWIDSGKLRELGPAYDVVSTYSAMSHESSLPSSESGERWGTGEVTIDSVSMSGPDGTGPEAIETGLPLSICVDYEVHQPVPELVMGLRITTTQGINVFGTNTKRSEVSIPTQVGRHQAVITIDSLPLLDGNYSLTLAVSDHTEINEYDHWENRTSFSVRQRIIQDEGIMTMGCRWIIR